MASVDTPSSAGPGPSLHPSLARLSEEQAAKYGSRPAVIFEDREYSYAEVHRRVLVRAARLRSWGIGKGDRVAYLGSNHPGLVSALLACLRTGAIFIPLNWRLAPAELDHQLVAADVSVLIVAPEHEALADATTVPVERHPLQWEAVTDADLANPPSLAEIAADAPEGSHVEEGLTAEDPAFILFTSGTTGHAKGAVLHHGNIIWNAFNIILDTDMSAKDVTLASAPLFHVAALNQQVMTSYIRGATTVFLPKWQADEVFDNVGKYGVTWLFGVTTMFADLVDSPRWESADLSTLRFVNSGGAPIPVKLINDFLERGIAFCQGYGLTETAPGATFLTAEDALRKPGSAGRAVPFADVKVVGADGGQLPPGKRGEILVRGPNVIKSYWDNETATREAFHADGWFRTGDIGYMDDEDYLYIVDRIKDMYISGGENVYPAEVEEVLFGHPDVGEVAVVADPDHRWGEVGHAYVVAKPGSEPIPEDIISYATQRLAKYKVPKIVTFLDDLPRTGSGKVHKPKLRGSGPLGAHSAHSAHSAHGTDSND
jgi:fatty-acyl-CoA synthase